MASANSTLFALTRYAHGVSGHEFSLHCCLSHHPARFQRCFADGEPTPLSEVRQHYLQWKITP